MFKSFDIFAASFYLLSRYEEFLPHVKDDYGRFLATESIAFKHDFLKQPVVDIWAYKLKSVLEEKFDNYPEHIRPKMEDLRALILETASESATVNRLEETLKWGEPSYLAPKGSTVRMDWKTKKPDQIAIRTRNSQLESDCNGFMHTKVLHANIARSN